MNKVYIGFTGLMESGKSTLANLLTQFLVESGYIVYVTHFANGVKKIAEKEFGWDGVKDEKGRKLLQVIGTDCGRMYNPNIWIERLVEEVGQSNADTQVVIIDDVRFTNEVDFIRGNNGYVVKVERLNHKLNDKFISHVSECGVKDIKADVLVSAKELSDLYRNFVIKCLPDILQKIVAEN